MPPNERDEEETRPARTEPVLKVPGAGERDAVPLGTLLGAYAVERVLGTGGCGIVYSTLGILSATPELT